MDGTQFLVQWDEHPSHLATRLGYLLEHQSLVDVTLMCNTHTLKVHRAVLAACSPYFERQLGNHPLIVLKDMKFSVLKSLVEFMYCGETSVSEDNLTSLLEAAKFFEVKGLSSMTKETVCSPSAQLNASKTFNGTATPTTSGYGRGSNRGRGRGRGRPPLNQSTKMGSPTESAQILLSLSGGLGGGVSSSTPAQLSTNPSTNKCQTKIVEPPSLVHSSTLDNKVSPKSGAYEPRRRGRKRGALNSAFRDRLLREQDTQMTIETLKRDLTEDGELGSPLLNSLLTKAADMNKSGGSEVANKYLKDMGLPGDMSILVDNGQGKFVISDDVLKSVLEAEDPVNFEDETKLSKNGNSRPYSQSGRSDDEDGSGVVVKAEPEETLDEDMIQTLRNGAVSEAENEPEAVVLFEVTDNKKVEKYVVSAKEVSLLKALNEQLTKQKKELADITKNNNLSTIDVAGSNTKVAELKLKIGKTKSILRQVVGYAQGLMKDKLQSSCPSMDKDKSQMVQLEFIDGNGDKIEGYQVTGTLVDKKESKDEFMGIFDMVCDNNPLQSSPLLGGETTDKDKLEGEPYLEESETIGYEIEAMMNDSTSNIVIEDKPDFKYIMDNDGNIMNQDEHYVVYESDSVIYDGALGGENSSHVINEEDHEYIVYSEDEDRSDGKHENSSFMVYDSVYNSPEEDMEDKSHRNNILLSNSPSKSYNSRQSPSSSHPLDSPPPSKKTRIISGPL